MVSYGCWVSFLVSLSVEGSISCSSSCIRLRMRWRARSYSTLFGLDTFIMSLLFTYLSEKSWTFFWRLWLTEEESASRRGGPEFSKEGAMTRCWW